MSGKENMGSEEAGIAPRSVKNQSKKGKLFHYFRHLDIAVQFLKQIEIMLHILI